MFIQNRVEYKTFKWLHFKDQLEEFLWFSLYSDATTNLEWGVRYFKFPKCGCINTRYHLLYNLFSLISTCVASFLRY